MLVLSLLFFALLLLLVFSLTKDTGRNTKHARSNATLYKPAIQQREQPAVRATEVVKVS